MKSLPLLKLKKGAHMKNKLRSWQIILFLIFMILCIIAMVYFGLKPQL